MAEEKKKKVEDTKIKEEEKKGDESSDVLEEKESDNKEKNIEIKEDKKEETKEDKKEDKKEESEEVAVPDKFKDIIEKIGGMSVIDLSDLVSVLEKKFNVSAVAPVMAGGNGGSEDKKSEVDIILKEVGEQKINVIKEVKKITGLGLRESKSLVDDSPKPIKKSVSREEAEVMKKELEEVGAIVSLE